MTHESRERLHDDIDLLKSDPTARAAIRTAVKAKKHKRASSNPKGKPDEVVKIVVKK